MELLSIDKIFFLSVCFFLGDIPIISLGVYLATLILTTYLGENLFSNLSVFDTLEKTDL